MRNSRRKSDPVIALLLLSLTLSGCGHASAEKLAEVSDLFEELQETRTGIEADYDMLYDDALFSRVTDAGQRLDALRDTDLSNATDETLDLDILPALMDLKESYATIRDLIDQTSEMEQAQVQATEYQRALHLHIVNRSGIAFSSISFALPEEVGDPALAEGMDASDGASSEEAKSNPAAGSTPGTDTDTGSAATGASPASTGSSAKGNDASTASSDADSEGEKSASKGTSMRNAASQAKTESSEADATDASTGEEDPEETALANAKILLSVPESVPDGATLAGISVPLSIEDAAGHHLVLLGTTSTGEEFSYDLGSADKLNDAVVFSLTLLPESTFEITSSLLN